MVLFFAISFLMGALCVSNIFTTNGNCYATTEEGDQYSGDTEEQEGAFNRTQIEADTDGIYTFSENKSGESFKVAYGVKEINGNGKTIYVKDLNSAIFDSLNGVEIYNLIIKFEASDSANNQPQTQNTSSIETLTTASNTVTAKSILAENIENANIHDIKIEGINLQLPADDLENTQKNVGILAQTITNSQIRNVWIKDCEISGNLNYNSNVGFIAGVVSGSKSGITFKDCLIENSELNLSIKNESGKHNFGGMCGLAENVIVQNNIINLVGNGNEEKISIKSDFNKRINFGGIAGEVKSNQSSMYNNAVLLNASSLNLQSSLSDSYIGSMVGYIESTINISGLVTSYNGKYVSNITDETGFTKMNKLSYSQIDYTVFASESYWANNAWCQWNFDGVWDISNNRKIPMLQAFETFSASFNPKESNNNLGFDVKPKQNIILGVITKTNDSEQKEDITSELNDIAFGETLYIYFKINDEKIGDNKNNYDKFFYIDGLALNGTKVYDVRNNQKLSGYEDISYDGENSKFVINNFRPKYAGEYSIILGKNEFRFSIKTQNEGSELNPFYPGGVKTNYDETVKSDLTVSLYFGDKIELYSVATDLDYADDAKWYWHDIDSLNELADDELIQFDTGRKDDSDAIMTGISGKYVIELNEDCALLSNASIDEHKENDLFEYYEIIDHNLVLSFQKGVKEIKIFLKDVLGKDISGNIASISIDGKLERVNWNEENSCYIAKVPLASSNHIVKIEGLEAEYAFENWDFGMGDTQTNKTGTFDNVDGFDEIYCVLKSTKKIVSGNLTWLWIVLGVVGGIGIIVVIIIFAKKSAAKKRTSYKRYYY